MAMFFGGARERGRFGLLYQEDSWIRPKACLGVTEIVERLADKDIPSLVEWAAFVHLGMSLLLNTLSRSRTDVVFVIHYLCILINMLTKGYHQSKRVSTDLLYV
jgi:hypothetical protein